MKFVRCAVVAAVSSGLLFSGLPAGPAVAGGNSWHVLGPTAVQKSRLSKAQVRHIDRRITTIRYGTGGEANFEHCGFHRTERLSLVRHTRWLAGHRRGITLIMQCRRVDAAKSVFRRAKRHYVGCTPATFGYNYPSLLRVKGSYIQKKAELRLQWAIDSPEGTTKKADGLAIRRAGAALIITRSETHNYDTINQLVNSKLTQRQYTKYRNRTFF